MQLDRDGALPATRAPEETFAGNVLVAGYFRRESPSRLSGATVTFAPGSRTPWKVSPLGQMVAVTRGVGRAQCEGKAAVEIRAGDTIWFPPGQRHWEGAAPDRGMTYVAVQEGGVEFKEKVSDEEYRLEPSRLDSYAL